MQIPPSQDIFSLLQSQARHRGGATALESAADGSSLSHDSLFRKVSGIIGGLNHRNLTPGSDHSRVAIVLPNGPAMAISLLAVSCAGVAVPFNPAFQESEFLGYFTETGVSYLLIQQGYAGPARKAATDIGLEILELTQDCTLLESSSQPTPCRPPAPHDVALILLTSGSTGRGKKVPLTHLNLCTSAWDVSRSISLDPGDRCLCMWEQFHIGGFVDLLLAPLLSGGCVISAGSFNVERFFSCLERFKPTWFQGVPTTLREACFFAKTHNIDPSRAGLRLIRSVAAALPGSWMEEIENRFQVPIIQTFGLTEASPLITSTGLLPADRKPGSTGKPCGPDVRIMDELGTPLPPLSHGQIAVRGNNIFKGYEGDDEANAACFRDGWFYTGDVGYVDADGFLFLTGRVKELINRGGEKIMPHEIDESLLTHPAIAQAAAFSIPHPTLGEDVGAAVVLKSGETLNESQIREHVSRHLAAFKVPRKIVVLPDLPRCPVGKVRRKEVAALAQQLSTSRPYQPPRNGLEQCLTDLWAAELDVPRVGIDDDFAELGGDSLTAVRLVTATQTLLQITLPDQVAGHLDSVRKMATYITRTGCPRHLLKPVTPVEQPPSFTPDEIQAVLSRLDSNTPATDFDPVEIRMNMRNCTSSNEFRLFRQNHLAWMTPCELLDLLGSRSAGFQPWTLKEILLPIRTLRWSRNRKKWSRQILSELSGMTEALRWKRRVVSDHAWLFSEFPMDEPSSNTLIVAFGGFGNRLFMPIFRFLSQLDPGRYDVLLLCDPSRAHYENGIPGLGNHFSAIPEVLEQFKRSKGYPHVIGFGTSAGGLPAIITALHNRWQKVIAIGADKPADHKVLNAMLDQLPATSTESPPTQVILAYAGKNPRDLAAAEEISRKVSNIRHLPDTRCSDHNILEELYKRSELKSFLNGILNQLP